MSELNYLHGKPGSDDVKVVLAGNQAFICAADLDRTIELSVVRGDFHHLSAADAIAKIRSFIVNASEATHDKLDGDMTAIINNSHAMLDVSWRKEPPDKPGWWWRLPAWRGAEPVCEFVTFVDDELCVTTCRTVESLNAFRLDEWAGPIEPPGREG